MAIITKHKDAAFYSQLLKGNYVKGEIALKAILDVPLTAGEFVLNEGGLGVVYGGFDANVNSRILYDTLENSGRAEEALNNHLRYMGIGVRDTFGLTIHSRESMEDIVRNPAASHLLYSSAVCMVTASESETAMQTFARYCLDVLPAYPDALNAAFASRYNEVRAAYMTPQYIAQMYGSASKTHAPWNVTAKSGGESFVNTGKAMTYAYTTGQAILMGDYIYFYGNSGNTTIMRASVSDPATVAGSGKGTPYTSYAGQLAVIGGYIYLYGSSSVTTVMRASVEDPLAFTTVSDVTLPYNVTGGCLVIANGYIHIYGASLAANNQKIMRAPVTAPTSFTDTGKTLPYGCPYGTPVTVGGYIYIYGSYATGNQQKIMRAPVSDPTSFRELPDTLPYAVSQTSAAIIGDYVYLYGGYGATQKIMRAPLNAPSKFAEITGGTLGGGYYNGCLVIVDDAVYLYGGSSANTQILRGSLL